MMHTILVTAYAVNPYKGSEDGTGWNMLGQIARYHKVYAITRKNNRPDIEKYLQANPQTHLDNIKWLYYDLPYWMRFWKKGGRGAMLYFYLWQLFMPIFVLSKKVKFDLAHNLNFHNDWTPSLLWTLGKPFVWGPIGHHPKTPENFVASIYGKKAAQKQKLIWLLKNMFWKLDPFLKLTKWNADHIVAINSSIEKVLRLDTSQFSILPAVASEMVEFSPEKKQGKEKFTILSIGRFVPLKGFDVCIESFANFYHRLNEEEQAKVELLIIGKGPQKEFLHRLAKEKKVENAIQFIEWMERSALTEIYQQANLFLFPSHEGAGMVVPEALSYGIPVVCFDNCGPGEMLNETCGRKVPYDTYQQSVGSLGDNVYKIFKDKDLQVSLSAGARKQFLEKFTWDRKGEHFKNIYSSLLQQHETKNNLRPSTQRL